MLRRCRPADEAAWVRLNKEFMTYEYQDENVWESPLEKGDPGEIFRRIMAEPNGATWLFMVEEQGQPIGFMNTVVFHSVWAHGRVLFLDDFFITEAFRGRGYGAAALAELERQIRHEGLLRVQLLAENTNPGAVRFYSREGYARQEINLYCKYLKE